MQLHIRKIGSGAKSMQVTHSSAKRDVMTVDKSISQDNAWHVVKGVTTVARSTILTQYAEGPWPARSVQFRKKIFMNKNLASKQ